MYCAGYWRCVCLGEYRLAFDCDGGTRILLHGSVEHGKDAQMVSDGQSGGTIPLGFSFSGVPDRKTHSVVLFTCFDTDFDGNLLSGF